MLDYQSPIPSYEEWRQSYNPSDAALMAKSKDIVTVMDLAYTAAKRAGDEALEELVGVLKRARDVQPNALAVIRDNGYVWEDKDSLGIEPGNWQHLSFSLYTYLCEINLWAEQALAKYTSDA